MGWFRMQWFRRARLAGDVAAVGMAVGAVLLVSLGAAADAAAAYPEKPIRVVVPYPPGGGTDVIARIVQDRLRQELGQAIVIDGAAGI